MSMYETAGKGLMYLFWAQIIALFSFIPFLGGFISLAAGILAIYAFYTMSQSTSGYKSAFILTIAQLVVSVITLLIFKSGFMNSVFNMVLSVINFLIVYFVCNSTGELLYGVDNALATRAGTLWKIYLICTAVSIVCSLLSVIPIINILAALVGGLIIIVQLVASILYMIFLWQSQKVLQSYNG